MLGAITGDIAGSTYEWSDIRSTEIPIFTRGSHFTDDTVMTIAVAEWIETDATLDKNALMKIMRKWGNRFPDAGYGHMFRKWLKSKNPKPYHSFGNGSAMRVSPVGWACDTIENTIGIAGISASVTHDHPEGIKGAQAIACAVFLAKRQYDKKYIRDFVTSRFGYSLNRTCEDIRMHHTCDATCMRSVPEAITAFLESTDFESTIRTAISLGGDTDTLACMAGAIAEAYYGGVPERIRNEVYAIIPDEFKHIIEQMTYKH